MFRAPNFSRRWKMTWIGILGACSVILGLLLSIGGAGEGLSFFERRQTGSPRLISIVPLPEMGPACEWVPASATLSLAAALQQERLAARSEGASPDEATRLAASQRKPVRIIHDPYMAYSSVAVDPIRNEVVMTDENLFQVVVYDRLDNTPPGASMTEPKRIIGGRNTKIEFQCGVYIDPASGDLYAVNNDTQDTLVIFSTQAQGNVPPDRELATPHGTFGIAVDEDAQELFLTIQHNHAVVVYRKMAQDDEAPIRLLQGDRTLLADPHGMAVDPKNKLIFITNHGSVFENRPGYNPRAGGYGRGEPKDNWPVDGPVPGTGQHLPPSITVYSSTAQGNTPPLRIIRGPKTQLNWPTGLAFDPQRDLLYVANDMGDSILVFSTTADGDTAPLRVLKGPKTLIDNPTGVAYDAVNDELWVTSFGNHSATVYKATAEGDTPPLRIIRSSPLGEDALMIGNPGAVAYDTKRDEILTPN